MLRDHRDAPRGMELPRSPSVVVVLGRAIALVEPLPHGLPVVEPDRSRYSSTGRCQTAAPVSPSIRVSLLILGSRLVGEGRPRWQATTVRTSSTRVASPSGSGSAH